jgi:hypothetical protein
VVDAAAAFSVHAACDPRAQLDRECYLSAFQYGADFDAHLKRTGTTKGYAGPCWSPRLWMDIDRKDDPAGALTDARRLVGHTLGLFKGFDEDDLLYFFSGSKGYHVGVPLAHPTVPSPTFHLICRRIAESLAVASGVTIDTSIYDRVRCFRAPNSRHPKTGRHKRWLSHTELFGLSLARIVESAAAPVPFDAPDGTPVVEIANAWQAAEAEITKQQTGRTERFRAERSGGLHIQRATLDFIREGANEGERHSRLFQAAANLREFGASPDLILALLNEAALDSGLPPAEVKRAVRNGIERADRQTEPEANGGAQ